MVGEEEESLSTEEFKEKCYPFRLSDFIDPNNSQFSCFTFHYDRSSAGFNVISGVMRVNDSLIVKEGEEGVIIVDAEKKELMRANDLDVSGVKHDRIADLDVDGNRWEGDVVDEKPCGWGIVYDRNNNKLYEGFRVGDKNNCYGREYYSDIGKVEYEGEWYEGVRWGRGIQYNRQGVVVYDGEWMNDEHVNTRVNINMENELFHNHIEELSVSDNCCNRKKWGVLDLRLIPFLRTLKIGKECFMYVDEVKLIGLKELESVEIGDNCFTKNKNCVGNDPARHFYLKDCPALRSLTIGSCSFSDYTVCEIENVDALEMIEMGGFEVKTTNFFNGSLELRSIVISQEVITRHAFSQITQDRQSCIQVLLACSV